MNKTFRNSALVLCAIVALMVLNGIVQRGFSVHQVISDAVGVLVAVALLASLPIAAFGILKAYSFLRGEK